MENEIRKIVARSKDDTRYTKRGRWKIDNGRRKAKGEDRKTKGELRKTIDRKWKLKEKLKMKG